MPSASAKFEKQGSLEVLEPLKQILTVVEKKVRNLEKRKGKLDAYKSDSQNGKELNDDQKKAVEKYDQVVEVLEFAKDMQKQFTSIMQETSKAQKKVAKREQLERQQHELHRFKEMITIQEILNSMGGDDVRQEFLAGANGAVKLTEEELNGLDELYKLICPEREGQSQESSEFEKQLVAASEHFQALLDSKNKEVVGMTYKALREVITKIYSCTYFNKTGVNNSELETEAATSTNDAKETHEISDGDEGSLTIHDGTESKNEEPSIPPGLSPNAGEKLYYHAENPSSFQDQTHPIQEVLPVQGNLNFLQESQINLDATPHPVVSGALHYPGNFVSTAQTSIAQDITPQSPYQQRSKDETSGSGHMTSSGQGIPNSIMSTSVPPQQSHLNFAGSALPTQGGSNALGDFDPNRPIPTQTYTNQSFNTAIHPMLAAAGVVVPQNYVPVTLAQMLSAHHGVGNQSVQQQPLPQRGPPGVPPPSSLDPSSLVSQSVHPVSTAVSKLSLTSQDAKDCFGNREFSMPQVSRERDNSHLNQPTSGTPTSQYERLNTHQQGYQSAHNSQAYINRDNFSTESSTYSSNLKRGLPPRGRDLILDSGMSDLAPHSSLEKIHTWTRKTTLIEDGLALSSVQRSSASRGGTTSVPRSSRGAYRT